MFCSYLSDCNLTVVEPGLLLTLTSLQILFVHADMTNDEMTPCSRIDQNNIPHLVGYEFTTQTELTEL